MKYIAGLYYVFDQIEISPCFVEGLDFAEASCRGVYVRWERDKTIKNSITLTVDFPEYTQGEIILRKGRFSDGKDTIPLEKGTYTVEL
jgi:hypothetical protein